MILTAKIKQQLKAQAHKLKPVVQIGQQGLTDAVNKAIDEALQTHELIKIHVATVNRNSRQKILNEICQSNHAELINIIGNVGIIYRENLKQKTVPTQSS